MRSVLLRALHPITLAFALLVAGCQSDPGDRPSPASSHGDEFGDPEAEQATGEAFEPLDPGVPEDRTPTVTSPPELPPPDSEPHEGEREGAP